MPCVHVYLSFLDYQGIENWHQVQSVCAQFNAMYLIKRILTTTVMHIQVSKPDVRFDLRTKSELI